MPRRFRVRPGLDEVYLPGAGKITTRSLLEGNEYAKFCPQYLVEILDSVPVRDPGPLLTEPLEFAPVQQESGDKNDPKVLVEKTEPPPQSVSSETTGPSFEELRARRRRGTRSENVGI